jgi:hypothetical protein
MNRVKARLKGPFRPSTHSAQHTATMALALFCLYYDVAFPAVHIFTLLSFLEFLIFSKLSVPSVRNYVSSIKSHFKLVNVSVHRKSARVRLLAIPGSPICPVASFLALQRSFLVFQSDPLLSYRVSGKLFLITQPQLRRALKRSVLLLDLSPHLTFHSFRRSAASLAFASGFIFNLFRPMALGLRTRCGLILTRMPEILM